MRSHVRSPGVTLDLEVSDSRPRRAESAVPGLLTVVGIQGSDRAFWDPPTSRCSVIGAIWLSVFDSFAWPSPIAAAYPPLVRIYTRRFLIALIYLFHRNYSFHK